MFASQVTKAVDIEGHGTFIVRKLNRTRRNEALSASQYKAVEHFKRVGGASFVKDIESLSDTGVKDAQAKAKDAVEKDPFLGYDRTMLIQYGVVSWPNGVTPAVDEIRDLEEDLEERLAREIYELCRPKSEEERKKD